MWKGAGPKSLLEIWHSAFLSDAQNHRSCGRWRYDSLLLIILPVFTSRSSTSSSSRSASASTSFEFTSWLLLVFLWPHIWTMMECVVVKIVVKVKFEIRDEFAGARNWYFWYNPDPSRWKFLDWGHCKRYPVRWCLESGGPGVASYIQRIILQNGLYHITKRFLLSPFRNRAPQIFQMWIWSEFCKHRA